MNLALVGLGRWAGRIIDSLPVEARVTTVVTRRPDAATVVPKGSAIVGRPEELEGRDIDAVIVANEASAHVRTLEAIWTIDPALPAFVEKPLALSTSSLKPLADAFGRSGRGLLLVDHVQLFNVNALALKAALSGCRNCSIDGAESNDGPVREDCSGLWDYGPHAVAMALFLAGEDTRDARIVSARRIGDARRHVVEFELAMGGSSARLSVGNGAVSRNRRYAVLDATGRRLEFDGLAAADPPPLSAALAAFCNAVRAGAAPSSDIRWGWELPAAVTRLLEDVERRVS
jgi:predicted dehydrogenase